MIDRRFRISHSAESPKLVPLPCERPVPFPLICANIAAGCLFFSSGPKYASRASGGSCSRRDQASSDTETTWNGTCMPCSTGPVHIDTHVAEQKHASFEVPGPACFWVKQAQMHLGGRTRGESIPHRHPIATWYITLKKFQLTPLPLHTFL